MKGDIILVEAHHRSAAKAIVDRVEPSVREIDRPYTMSVAGESGSGKSETGKALAAARSRPEELAKPLVDYDSDSIAEETVDLSGVDVVIAEGTYTTLLERVLEIEHEIIAPHRGQADVIISNDYEVSFVDR